MSDISHIDLEKLLLKFQEARLRGNLCVQAQVLGLDDSMKSSIASHIGLLENVWLCRGADMRFELSISIRDTGLGAEDAKELQSTLLNAKVFVIFLDRFRHTLTPIDVETIRVEGGFAIGQRRNSSAKSRHLLQPPSATYFRR